MWLSSLHLPPFFEKLKVLNSDAPFYSFVQPRRAREECQNTNEAETENNQGALRIWKLHHPSLLILTSCLNSLLTMIANGLYRTSKFHRILSGRLRPFSSFSSSREDHAGTHKEAHYHMPVTQFTEDEQMARDTARNWANEELKPLVREMDDECKTRPEVIRSLFDHGFMGMVSFS